MLKFHCSFSRQVEILQERGLIIDNAQEAEIFLQYVNYYHIRGYYTDCFDSKQNIFTEPLTFENLVSRIDEDRLLRRIYFYFLESVELNVKTQISYFLSQKYGGYGYLDDSNFTNSLLHQKLIQSLNDTIQRSSEIFVKHHASKQNKEIPILPIWIAIELLTFGSVSKHLYHILTTQDKKQISDLLKIKSQKVLASFLRALTLLRNICAHHSRLYNRPFADSIALLKYHKVFIQNECKGFKLNDHYLFAYTLGLLQLLPKKEKDLFISELKAFEEHHKSFSLYRCGFPNNWINVLNELK